jgi:hypothetical protein
MLRKYVCCVRASACVISARLQAQALTPYASARASSVEAFENKCPEWHIVILIKVLTLDYCKAILNQGERTYSTDEVRIMREFLYQVAGIEMENNESKTERR